MKNLLKGFTLAEVLISLTIVGILAAVTLPALNSSFQAHQIGPQLAKAINSLEATNKLVLQDQSTPTLGTICDSTAKYPSCIKNYLNFANSNNTSLETKDGFIYLYSATGTASNAPSYYNGRYYTIYVDVNGKKKPNISGIDQFRLDIDKNGTVIPYGGNQYKTYTSGGSLLWSAGCANNPKAVPTTPLTCAGAIADNGFKVNYNVSTKGNNSALFTP